ncbi:hypothetical protein HMI56_001430 [Coelomomyces lativittatus]|nr:hypothetical protein HMI56_001430 [Coelomomyces lativittatus]
MDCALFFLFLVKIFCFLFFFFVQHYTFVYFWKKLPSFFVSNACLYITHVESTTEKNMNDFLPRPFLFYFLYSTLGTLLPANENGKYHEIATKKKKNGMNGIHSCIHQ